MRIIINIGVLRYMNIKLSDRMLMVAKLAEGKIAADIGCDHGYVSIYLVNEAGFDKVIAMDLREGPLKIAKAHVMDCNLMDKISIRLSDGFEKLMPMEADCAVIAGMGGILMTNILKRGKIHTDNGINLVLQPQSDYDEVRKYLCDVGYCIEDEDMLFEEGKYYIAMKAKKSDSPVIYSDIELKYGPVLLKKNNRFFSEYLNKEKTKIIELIDKLKHINTSKAEARGEKLKKELRELEIALNEVS